MLFNNHVYFVCIYVYPIHWPGGHWPGGYSSSVRTSCESIGVGTDPRHLSNLTHCSWPLVRFLLLGALWKALRRYVKGFTIRVSNYSAHVSSLVGDRRARSIAFGTGFTNKIWKSMSENNRDVACSINSFSDSTRLLASLLFKNSLKVCLGRRMTSKFQCQRSSTCLRGTS